VDVEGGRRAVGDLKKNEEGFVKKTHPLCVFEKTV
jgi:hypothetical protein